MTVRAKKGGFGPRANSERISEFEGETFADRLRTLIGEGSANAFARECAIGETSVRQYLHGGVPGLDKVIQIARAKNVRVEWLATGEGPRSIQTDTALPPIRTESEHMRRDLKLGEMIEAGEDDAIALPRLSVEGSAGYGLIPTHEEIEDYLSVSRRYLREVGINPTTAHVLRLSGHSMAPTLRDKDLVIVDTSQTMIRDEEIYALAYGETVLIKRLRPRWNGDIRIISDNKDGLYHDDVVPASDRGQLHIVGRVGGFLRYI